MNDGDKRLPSLLITNIIYFQNISTMKIQKKKKK